MFSPKAWSCEFGISVRQGTFNMKFGYNNIEFIIKIEWLQVSCFNGGHIIGDKVMGVGIIQYFFSIEFQKVFCS